ncbi:MAG: ASCH domain-containing protein [Candidatus Njordarchaeota archaeon]
MNRNKKSFIGKHLMLKGKYAEKILNGNKVTTIRRGRIKVLSRDILIHAGGKIIARAKVVDVKTKKLRELTDDDARLDGFKNKDDLKKELKKIYPNIKEHERVTIIKFRVTEHMNQPEERRYRGKTAIEVAEIALKNIDKINLTELEKNVLGMLLEKKSLRAVAREIYGNINARKKVRDIVWKVLGKLEKERVI